MKYHVFSKFIAVLLCAAMLALSLGCGAAVVVLGQLDMFDSTVEDLRAEKLDSAANVLANYLVLKYALENLTNCPEEVLVQEGSYDRLNGYLDNTYAVLFQEGKWHYSICRGKESLASDGGLASEGQTLVYEVSRPYPVVVGVAPWEAIYPEEMEVQAVPRDSVRADTEERFPGEEKLRFLDTLPQDMEYQSICGLEGYDGQFYAYLLSERQTPEYTVSIYVEQDGFCANDSAAWALVELARAYRWWLVAGLIVGLLLFAGALVYLCCCAGRKPGREEIKAGGLNALPLDLYGLLSFIGIYACVYFVIEMLRMLDGSFYGRGFQMPVLFAGLLGYAGCLLAVGFLFAFAAQVKTGNGYWWRHSVLGWSSGAVLRFFRRLFRRTGRLIQKFYELLPLGWQWLVSGLALLGILVIGAATDGGMLLLAVLIYLSAIGYGVYCFGTLYKGAKSMSRGNLSAKVPTRYLIGGFRRFAEDLNALGEVAVVAAQQQMKSERMRAELITNVSHDIKTPLTSIINYVDLMQKAGSREEAERYLEVLSRQSLRMKKLIGDLIEMSKASTGNLPVDIRPTDAVETVNQALGEFADKLEAARITPVVKMPEGPVMILADGRLAWRVLSNLLSNAVKYALPDTRLYIDVVRLELAATVSLKNISREALNVSADELMERFVRGDTSRNTEGSGLGLNIAKSLMELQHGQLQLLVDGDLFKATLYFPIAPKELTEA